MSDYILKTEDVSKRYRLGVTGTRTLSDDIKNFWAKVNGKQNPALSIEQAENTAKETWALRDINFEVKQGEALGIIGKNGAGKSTLLKLLSKVTLPTTGRIKYRGRIASLLEVGTGFHGELTGRENIYLNGAILGMNRFEITKKFDEIVAFSGVEKYIDTPVKRYSSGMYVRLAFAVAAHLDPEILIVDEVLAVGDAEFQRNCINKMKDVAGEGRTVLFVSHNMTTITSLCSRAILLDKGKLKAAGTSLDMVAEYLNMNTQEECPSYLYEYDGLKNISEPPSERVILQNAKLLYEDGSYAKVPKTTDTLFIEIEYEVNNITALLIPDLNLYGGPGEELIFTSVRNEDNSHTNGRYKTSIEIPKNFLNLGVYTVGLEINSMDPFNRHVGFRRLLQFEVFDDLNSGSREGHVSLFTRGLIRPEIKWESNKL